MDDVTGRLARRYLVRHTHSGLVLDFPRIPLPSALVAFGVFGWMVVGTVSLWAIAYPVAAFVEQQGWWLVNEAVLSARWRTYGLPIWPVVFFTLYLWARGPVHQRVKVDNHGVAWRRRLGWARVTWSELRTLDLVEGRLWLFTRSGASHRLPAIQRRAARDLARLIEREWQQARPGDEREIPKALRSLLADSARP